MTQNAVSRRRPVAIALGVVALVGVVAAGALLVVHPWMGSTATARPTTSPTASPSATASPTPSGPVTVRWFVGIGSSGGMDNLEPQRSIVKRFNESQSRIVLKVEIVPNSNAYDILKTQIAAGDPPDIIGPVGLRGRNGFEGLFLDLDPLIASHKVGMSTFDPALLPLFADGNAQVGLPYLIYPAYMFYNKDLFAKAKLPDLPKRVGETYMGKTWDWNAVAKIGLTLTVDAKGKHPNEAGFDSSHIVQFGIDFQWWDGRRMASAFVGGSFVKADGYTAQIPDVWRDAWNWYYQAMWQSHIAPTGKYINGALLNNGTTISSGKIAMAATNPWTINSYGTKGKATFKAWDMAVMPSWNGQTSGPLDADTFVIVKACKHPDEAFEAMLALMADVDLMTKYGGIPADKRLQAAYFAAQDASLGAIFPNNKVSWEVLDEMSGYPAIPSHEANMPNFLQATSDYAAFYTQMQNDGNLNLSLELMKLQETLQIDFDAIGPPAVD